ncbi:GP46-like surface antigen, putative, partial [Bodo saltans]
MAPFHTRRVNVAFIFTTLLLLLLPLIVLAIDNNIINDHAHIEYAEERPQNKNHNKIVQSAPAPTTTTGAAATTTTTLKDSSTIHAALMNIYNSCNGTSWTSATNWGSTTASYCTWAGVTCSGSNNAGPGVLALQLNFGLKCNPFPWSQLGGDLGAGLFVLDVSGNPNIAGALADSLPTDMPVLQSLNLGGTSVSGTLPAAFGAVTSPWRTTLEILTLTAAVHLQGTIPATWSEFQAIQQLNLNGLSMVFGTYDAVPLPQGTQVSFASDASFTSVFVLENNDVDVTVDESTTSITNVTDDDVIDGHLPLGLYVSQGLTNLRFGTNNSFTIGTDSLFAGLDGDAEDNCLLLFSSVNITATALFVDPNSAYVSHYMYFDEALTPCLLTPAQLASGQVLIQMSFVAQASSGGSLIFTFIAIGQQQPEILQFDFVPIYNLSTSTILACTTFSSNGGPTMDHSSTMYVAWNEVTLVTTSLIDGTVAKSSFHGNVLINASIAEGYQVINVYAIIEALSDALPPSIVTASQNPDATCTMNLDPAGNAAFISCSTDNPYVWGTCNSCLASQVSQPSSSAPPCRECFTLPHDSGLVQLLASSSFSPSSSSPSSCFWTGSLVVNEGQATLSIPTNTIPCMVMSYQSLLIATVAAQPASNDHWKSFLLPLVADGQATEVATCPVLFVLPQGTTLCAEITQDNSPPGSVFYSLMTLPEGNPACGSPGAGGGCVLWTRVDRLSNGGGGSSNSGEFPPTAIVVHTPVTTTEFPVFFNETATGEYEWPMVNVTGFVKEFASLFTADVDAQQVTNITITTSGSVVQEMKFWTSNGLSLAFQLILFGCRSDIAGVLGVSGVSTAVTSIEECAQGPEFVLALLEVRAEGGDARTPSSPIYYNYTMRTPDTWTTPSMQPLPPGAFALSLEYLWLAATQSAADAGILPVSTALTFQLQSDASVCTTTEWLPIGGAFCASVSASSSPAPVFDRFVTLLLSAFSSTPTATSGPANVATSATSPFFFYTERCRCRHSPSVHGVDVPVAVRRISLHRHRVDSYWRCLLRFCELVLIAGTGVRSFCDVVTVCVFFHTNSNFRASKRRYKRHVTGQSHRWPTDCCVRGNFSDCSRAAVAHFDAERICSKRNIIYSIPQQCCI